MKKFITLVGVAAAVLINVACPPPPATKVKISTTTLENSRINKEYTGKILAEGGSGNYIFTISEGALPAGLTLDQAGTVSGTTNDAFANYTFTVKAEDAKDSSNYDTKELSIRVVKALWTVLLHFAIDNDLDSYYEQQMGIVTYYLETLEGIKAADTAGNIEILILMDCSNYVSKFHDGYYRLTGGNINNDLAVSISEINSGNPEDTKTFMDWVEENYPGVHYLYSIFNHGSGFDDKNQEGTQNTNTTYGIGFDNGNDIDSLSHHELGITTEYLKQKIGHKIDIFYTYACLMAGIELAYEVRNNADYLLFSEELFPLDKWSYEALNSIISNASISSLDLGKAFCDSAYNYFTGLNPARPVTLSLVDLSKIDKLYTSINDYAVAALSEINSNSNIAKYFNNAVLASYSMGYDKNYYYVDLGNYLDYVIATPEISTGVKNLAKNTKADFSNCVAYEKNNYQLIEENQYWVGINNLHPTGLTIYHNTWRGRLYPSATYKKILAFGTNAWADYVEKMNSLETPSSPEPDEYEKLDDSSPYTTNKIALSETQYHTLHEINNTTYFDYDRDNIKFNLQEQGIALGSNIIIETHKWNMPTDTIIFLYDASGNYVFGVDDDSGDEQYSKMTWNYNDSSITEIIIAVGPAGVRYGDYSINVRVE